MSHLSEFERVSSGVVTVLVVYFNQRTRQLCLKWQKEGFFAGLRHFKFVESHYPLCTGSVGSATRTLEQQRPVPTVPTTSSPQIELISVFHLEQKSASANLKLKADVVSVYFVGMGTPDGIEGFSVGYLWGLVRDCSPTVVSFLGCDVGSPRAGPTLLLSHSHRWGDTIAVGFDQKVTLGIIKQCGILAALASFAALCVHQPNMDRRQLFRYACASGFAHSTQPFIDTLVFFNDLDVGDDPSSTRKAVALYEEYAPLDPPYLSSFLSLIQLHSWTCNPSGTKIFECFLDKFQKSPSTMHAYLIQETLKQLGVSKLIPLVNDVYALPLSNEVIRSVCSGLWDHVDSQPLAVAIARGYRALHKRRDVLQFMMSLASRSDDPVVRVATLLYSERFYVSDKGSLHVALDPTRPQHLTHLKEQPLHLLPLTSGVSENDLLHFWELYQYLELSVHPWAALLKGEQPLDLQDLGSISAELSKLSPALVKNRNIVSYSSKEFLACLTSLFEYVDKSLTDSEKFDAKKYEEGDTGRGFMFDKRLHKHEYSFAETNVASKTSKSLNTCRFIYVYKRTETGHGAKGVLYFTDVHYGDYYMLLADLKKEFTISDCEKGPFKRYNRDHEKNIRAAISVMHSLQRHPFSYCGELVFDSNGIPSLNVDKGVPLQ